MQKVLLLIFVCIYSISFAQNGNKIEYFSNGDVTINVIPKDCVNPSKGTAKQYLFIEIINTTSSELKISLDKEIWYNNKCHTCNSNSQEYKIEVILPANSAIEGNCDSKNKTLRIFSKMLNLEKVRKLSKYELKNIKVEAVK